MTDNRVDKTCCTLKRNNYDVFLIGRKKRSSPKMNNRQYPFLRMRLLFEKSFFFYAELNLRLFFKLLFSKADVLWANDLDVLLPNYLVSKIRNIPLIYDSHEYFTEVPELKNNPFAKWFWKRLEKMIMPHLKYVITVCNPIAEYFKNTYNVSSLVVRNFPMKTSTKKRLNKKQLNMPEDKPILIWQGSGLNIERGLEELVESMQWINAYLYIIGNGDITDKLKTLSHQFNVSEKIRFIPRLPFDEMMQYTFNATIGLSLDKDTNINYSISLPNKLFEYIFAAIPILITRLSEIKSIVETFNVGEFLIDHSPINIAKQINLLLEDDNRRKIYSDNCLKAKAELCWEEEEKKILYLMNLI
ncbi:MAG: glycosyltransferase [Methanobrevibacter sp.]|nr:glycosyltransferase [Candidatus Methanoflexus mossambicus]